MRNRLYLLHRCSATWPSGHDGETDTVAEQYKLIINFLIDWARRFPLVFPLPFIEDL